MKIHSSSLTSIPSGYIAKNRNDSPQTLIEKKDKPVDARSVAPPTQLVKNETDLPSILGAIEQRHLKPSNSRTAHALNAYIQENSQPLKSQRSELVTGIDTFA